MLKTHHHQRLGEHLLKLIRTNSLRATTLELCKRDIIYAGIDDDRCLYLVERGRIKIVATAPDGKESLLHILTSGDVMGEASLLGRQRCDSAVAMSDVVVKRMPFHEVMRALDDQRLRQQFVEYLVERVFEQQCFINDLITTNSERRLASVLLHLARRLGHRSGEIIRLRERITQEELAAMVGTTRSRVGYFLKRFHEAHLLQRENDCFLSIDEHRMTAFVEGFN
ncbi:CRP-like cAMP-binding protein [Stackebrandtia endophytica]|uniref:CRP-like cAMP-binding protein n=1 Tax=Stackebrandtia endophytica TaxID=1496996 RepID=A0A543ARX5_9ACTN|nr:Crp/Fnr family transcriptional regulator [Stackebrandtia endophytica]TQL75328.1 CRP-like cAMP-binding protein [Stackebrandtia endophytica]